MQISVEWITRKHEQKKYFIKKFGFATKNNDRYLRRVYN